VLDARRRGFALKDIQNLTGLSEEDIKDYEV
jgi:hypothetical protein